MFNIVVLSYASSAYDNPRMREFMGLSEEVPGRRRSSSEGRWTLIVVAILGGGLALGFLTVSLVQLAVSAFIIGLALNLYLLISFAFHIGRTERLPGVLLGALPAGAYDGLKILLIGLLVRWLRQI